MTATRTRYIPAGATKISDKHSDAVAYIYSAKNGRPAMLVYFGKQTKEVAHYSYRTSVELEKNVKSIFASRQSHIRARAEYKAMRLASNALAIGDILSSVWGYEQTNVDFYEVVDVMGQHVTICKIASASEETGNMSGRCVPQSGEFIGEPVRKLVKFGTQVSINNHTTARKWNTAEIAGVRVGPALSFTTYG